MRLSELKKQVFAVAEINPPLANSVIVNPIYDQDDHVLRHYSLGAFTTVIPQPSNYSSFYFVHSGTLKVEYKGRDNHREVTVPAGSGFARPSDTMCLIRAEEATVYTEATFPRGVQLNPLFTMEDVPIFRNILNVFPNMVTDAYIVKDDNYYIGLSSYDTGCERKRETLLGDAAFTCLEGECILTLQEKEYTLNADETFILPEGHEASIKAVVPTKLLLVAAAVSEDVPWNLDKRL